jgi:neutral ceramidase
MNTTQLLAGSAVTDITPTDSQFLYGYPRVPRMSEGVHDRLLASALYLEAGGTACLYIANDILWANKATVARVRDRITAVTGILGGHITISCTHTHSGPITFDCIIAEVDPVVPKVDPAYVALWEDRMVDAGINAWKSRRAATLSHGIADATGVGTNRHHPKGPSDLNVPVLVARETTGKAIAVMLICAMHPTVLHEDSKLISGDFPAEARLYLQKQGVNCPIVYHIGAAGDQSPRHVTRGNTFDESRRLGEILGKAVVTAIASAKPIDDPRIVVKTALVDLPARQFPRVDDALDRKAKATFRFQSLRDGGAPRTDTRTAECDMFGADETVVLAQAAASGRLAEIAQTMLPAEIQVIAVGPLRFVAWPGELFVDFALRVKQAFPNASVFTLANGDLQAYLVTQQAVDENWYEAGNAIFQSPTGGNLFVDATLKLLREMA